MLASSKVIGFVPTKDAQRARAFYEGKLEFRFVSDDQFALVLRAGETMIRIAKAQDFTPAPYAVLGWEVREVEAVVRWLQKRGVAPSRNIPSFRIRSWESGRRPAATRLRGSRIRMGTCSPSASMTRERRIDNHEHVGTAAPGFPAE
jgi:hypothetical protein